MGNKQNSAADIKVDPKTGLTESEKRELQKAYDFSKKKTTENDKKRGLNRDGFYIAVERLAQSNKQNLFEEIKKLKHQRTDFVKVISETLFDSFDVQNNDEISLEELMEGIAVCMCDDVDTPEDKKTEGRKTTEDKMKWGFRRLVHHSRPKMKGKNEDLRGTEGMSSGSGYDNNHRSGKKSSKSRGSRSQAKSDSSSGDEGGSDYGISDHGSYSDRKEDRSSNNSNRLRRRRGKINVKTDAVADDIYSYYVTENDLRRVIENSVKIQRKHQHFIETRALVSAQQLCETLNRQLSDARLSELRLATASHVEQILLKAEKTIDQQVKHCIKLMDIDKDGFVNFEDYKTSLSRNPTLLQMINPFSIHSILEDATSGNPNRVGGVSIKCESAVSLQKQSGHQPRHRERLHDSDDWANMVANSATTKVNKDGVITRAGAHALTSSKSAKRIRPGKKRQSVIDTVVTGNITRVRTRQLQAIQSQLNSAKH